MNNITIFICVFYLVPVIVNSYIFYKMRKQANYVEGFTGFENHTTYTPIANFLMMIKFIHLAKLTLFESGILEFYSCWNLLPNISVVYKEKKIVLQFPIWGMLMISYNVSVEIGEGKAK